MELKGKATIQLFDGKTGEIVNEIHEENMITNAVSTIINPPDFIEFGVDNTLYNRSNNFLKIFKDDLINGAFGGVNPSIKGSTTHSHLTVLSNCVGWVVGRTMEILQTETPIFAQYNTEDFIMRLLYQKDKTQNTDRLLVGNRVSCGMETTARDTLPWLKTYSLMRR